MSRRTAQFLLAIALVASPSGRAAAHDSAELNATRIHVSGAGRFAIESGVGLVVRSETDPSQWSLLCTDSTSVGRSLGAAIVGDEVVLATEAGVRTYALDRCERARSSVPFDGLGTAFAATPEGDALHALRSDDGKLSTLLVSLVVSSGEVRVDRERALPTPVRDGRLFLLGDVPCATGRGDDELAHVECVDESGWSDHALPLPKGTRVEPVAVVAHEAVLRAVLAVRTPFDEPDGIVITSDRGASLDGAERALEGIEKVKGAARVGDRLLLAARAVAGADAVRGKIYALDLATGSLEVVAADGPPYECLAADASGLYACINRGVDPAAATILVSTNEGASWEHVFSFTEISSVHGCGGAQCLTQRASLCTGVSLFCDVTAPVEPSPGATPEPASAGCGCATPRAGGGALPPSLALVVALARVRARRAARSGGRASSA